ncbi:PREDICTED: pentatricopeptide repeat-containing protein DOT4, chloroplastic-like [Fragaria vesca subsp. vesca]|uniref:pentatricopeptide repeat-containing protein DOT4, chloroplastic-like n=1 Tax=Fragaria vesca subsp. vesca TaxID=101020 RepID=UPI0002C30D83|nr:PREDICTED: pentatricopeptide repeat-containing protein DOT4, chloroplastic-like [Fragaria vesca subsp. vesca]
MEALPSLQTQRLLIKDNPINCASQQRHSRNVQTPRKVALAHRAFDGMSHSDTYAWNKLIQTHIANNDFHYAVSTYDQMLHRGVRPDRHTLPRALSASRLSDDLSLGKQLHCHAVKFGCANDRYVIAALIELYGRLQSADTAKCVFDKASVKDLVSWTMIARLYIVEGKPRMALDMFDGMVESGAKMDAVALATAAGACGMMKSMTDGVKVHRVAKEQGLEFDVLVSNSLSKMYIDCGCLEDARAIFDQRPAKDVISWTEMIRVYVKKGGFNEGLKLFRQMAADGLKPDQLSVSSVLPACARVSAYKQGKEIHGYLLRNGIHMNLTVQNALMDMYIKSGFIESALKIFAGLKHKDVISYTVMILGYSLHGQGPLGVDLFRQMEKELSIKIDELTYAAVLHACVAARMVKEGKCYFNCIKTPTVAHCALLVALLSHSGLFDEARSFISEKRIEGHAEVLRALLDGCRIHKQLILGKRLAEQLCDLEPLNPDNYVLLSNLYADNEKWDTVFSLRGMITDMGLKPKEAFSWIEFRNKIHVFGTRDAAHPRSERLYWELQSLMKKMEDEDIIPDLDYSLHDVYEERECIQIGHSEMLAISFGLISSQTGTTIRVTKNLRVCRNCHASAKAISKMVGREIILKDPKCFHHFKDGYCSCGDFW